MKKKAVLFALMLLILANVAIAAVSIDVTITPKKTEFREGDLLAFDYSISSGARQDIVYAAHISCPQAPVAIIEKKTTLLRTGVPVNEEYRGAVVDSETEPQTCTASITTFSPEYKVVKRDIRITTSPSFDFTLSSCTDSACSKKQRTFVKGNAVYLKGNSAGTAQITAPDKSTQRITLPGSFTASKSGEYTIDISATKTGYKSFASTASIFIVEQAYTVPYADFSSKLGQAVVRPVFKAPSVLAVSNTAVKTPLKTTAFRSLFSRITGYFTLIF